MAKTRELGPSFDTAEANQRINWAVPQCNISRGSPFMDGDPEAHSHKNMIGPTLHC